MLPLNLDLCQFPVLLIGSADQVSKRRAQLEQFGAGQITLINADQLPQDIAQLDWTQHRILMVCNRELPQAAELATTGRQHGMLVWVEDQLDLCDFHLPALVQRGDLTLAVSTGGKSPGLARAIRQKLEQLFPPEWKQRLEQIAELRDQMRRDGASPGEVNAATQKMLQDNQWL